MSSSLQKVCREIIDELISNNATTEAELDKIRFKVCQKYSLKATPGNSDILSFTSAEERRKLLPLLRRKPIRSVSGVAVVAVMTKPYPCPKDQPCTYCPGGPPQNLPQSYTGHEPTSARGIEYGYDPHLQVSGRIDQLRRIGHTVDKVELIVMGGTFPAMPTEYQEYFVKECLDAITGKKTRSIKEAEKEAESSGMRISGITFETRPDWGKEKDVDHMLSMGVTRVEIGVQNVYDDVYTLVDRGHTVEDVVEATRILKDAGLKCAYHMMPGLPGSSYERDLSAFETLFRDPRFRPDELKIYPTLVLEGTRLFDVWKEGGYTPLSTDQLVDLITRVKTDLIPEYVRIKRVMRDIPAQLIVAGPRASNLRELVWRRIAELGGRCRCIRCREVGHVKEKFGIEPDPDNIRMRVLPYDASDGTEIFLSYEDVKNDILIGFLRLRVPSEHAHRKEVREVPSVIVRELHVYGPLVKVGREPKLEEWQHRGYGRMLLQRAEEIGRDQFDAKRVLVTSGLGVKEYYYNLGYKSCGPYVAKSLV